MKEILYTLAGAAGMKAIDFLFLRGKFSMDEASSIRKELREEVGKLRAEIAELEKELELWKDKYYDLKGQYSDLKSKYDELAIHYSDLQADVDKARQEATLQTT